MTSSKLPEELEEKIALKYFAPMCFTTEQAVLMLRNFVNEYGLNLFPEIRSQKEGLMSAEEIYVKNFNKLPFPERKGNGVIYAAMREYAAQFEAKWRPISEAPKDFETPIVRWLIKSNIPVVVTRLDANEPVMWQPYPMGKGWWMEDQLHPFFIPFVIPSPKTPQQ